LNYFSKIRARSKPIRKQKCSNLKNKLNLKAECGKNQQIMRRRNSKHFRRIRKNIAEAANKLTVDGSGTV